MFGVKKCLLFEGVSLRLNILAEHYKCTHLFSSQPAQMLTEREKGTLHNFIMGDGGEAPTIENM